MRTEIQLFGETPFIPDTTPVTFGARRFKRIEFDPTPDVTVLDSTNELPKVKVSLRATAWMLYMPSTVRPPKSIMNCPALFVLEPHDVGIPLSFISLIILRSFNWREWMVLLLGLITPLYIYLSICYLTSEDYFAVFSMMREATSSIQKPIVSEYYFGFIFIVVLSFGFAFIRYLSKGFGSKVKTQKTKYVLLWMLLFCIIIMLFEQISDMILLPCIIPLSIFIGDYLAEIKQLKIANTLLIIILGAFTIQLVFI